MSRWGKAGVRLTEQQAEQRAHAAVTRRNRDRDARTADDRIGYRLWRAGELKPYLITLKLDSCGLFGPEVDLACGAKEPDVDLWEVGNLYPTWAQVLLLAKLVGATPRFLCSRVEPMRVAQTSMRFHGYDDESRPTVWAYDTAVVQATVGTAPFEMPEPTEGR